jgi:hypothetical protein
VNVINIYIKRRFLVKPYRSGLDSPRGESERP